MADEDQEGNQPEEVAEGEQNEGEPNEGEPNEDEPGSEEAENSGDGSLTASSGNKEVSQTSYQICVFVSCFIGHCLFLYNRRVFQFILPHVMNEGTYSGMEITLIIMLQQISYTLSCFFVGNLLDTASPKTLFAIGTFVTGFFNFGFSDVDEPANLMLLASLHGFAQGLGWPCCVKVIRNWFPAASFGFWWAILNQSHFLIGIAGSAFANSWAYDYGWRIAIQMPAVISMIFAFALYFANVDKPSDVGYEDPIFKGEETNLTWSDIIGVDFMLVCCGTGFLMNLVRQSTGDWGALYLMQDHGISQNNAKFFMTCMEVGGAVGTVVVGSLADAAVKKKVYIGNYKFPRLILLFVSMFAGAIILSSLLLACDAYTTLVQVNLYAFLMGFNFHSASQNIETIVIETAPPNRVNSCYALLYFSANMAVLFAGFPMSFLAAAYGWSRVFMLANFVLLVSFFAVVIGKDLDKSFIPAPPKSKKVR